MFFTRVERVRGNGATRSGKRTSSFLTIKLLLLLWHSCIFPTVLMANQDEEAGTAIDNPLDAEVRKRLDDQLQLAQGSADTDAAENYQKAIDSFDKAAEFQGKIDDANASIEASETNLAKVQASLTSTPLEPEEGFAEDWDLATALAEESRLTDAKDNANNSLNEFQKKLEQRNARRQEITKQLPAIDEDISKLEVQLANVTASEDRNLLSLSKEALLQQELNKLTTQRKWFETELLLYQSEAELIPASIDLANRQLQLAEKRLKKANNAVAQLRKDEANRIELQISSLRMRLAEFEIPEQLFQQATLMNEQRRVLADKLNLKTNQISRADEQWQEQLAAFEKTQQDVQDVGTTQSMGSYLRAQRSTLPTVRSIRDEIRQRQVEIRETELKLYDAIKLRKEYAIRVGRLDDILLDSNQVLSIDQRLAIEEFRELIRMLSRMQQQELDEYLDQLFKLNLLKTREIATINEFQDYIDETILWIQSHRPIWKLERKRIIEGFEWPFKNITFRRKESTPAIPPWVFVGTIVGLAIGFVLLLWQNHQLRQLIQRQAERVSRRSCKEMVPTIRALFATIGIALPWPLVLLAGSAILLQADTAIMNAVGEGTFTVAIVYFCFELARQASRFNGLFIAHFHWSEIPVKRFRHSIRWSMLFILPPIWIHEVSQALNNELVHDVVGRFSFCLAMVLLTIWVYRTLHPSHGIFSDHIARFPEGWASRLRYGWLMFAIAIPLTLLTLCCCGYFISAEQLFDCLVISYLLALALLLLSGLVNRWMVVLRLRLRFQQLLERSQNSDNPAPVTGEETWALEEGQQAVDLRELNAQSIRLVRNVTLLLGLALLLMVWTPVLPALHGLDQITMWTVKSSDGEIELVTLKSLLIVIPTLFAIFLMAKNAPGTIEILVLQRLPIDQSIRYAITTISRYVIVVIGILFAASRLGIQWEHVQFLVAALGVGLGFGLQEVFANFVSGLILLFERPVRVGDVVTVSDVTGVVTRIQIRATTIRNWDKQDYIVPNKDLVTGRLLNWTLADSLSRFTITVGVSYNEEPQKVTDKLAEVIDRNELVLAEPKPLITFEGFDDSSLRFVIRAHVAALDHRLQVIHELHSEILACFREAKIEIPFPQLDLHVPGGRPVEQKPPTDLAQFKAEEVASKGS